MRAVVFWLLIGAVLVATIVVSVVLAQSDEDPRAAVPTQVLERPAALRAGACMITV